MRVALVAFVAAAFVACGSDASAPVIDAATPAAVPTPTRIVPLSCWSIREAPYRECDWPEGPTPTPTGTATPEPTCADVPSRAWEVYRSIDHSHRYAPATVEAAITENSDLDEVAALRLLNECMKK